MRELLKELAIMSGRLQNLCEPLLLIVMYDEKKHSDWVISNLANYRASKKDEKQRKQAGIKDNICTGGFD